MVITDKHRHRWWQCVRVHRVCRTSTYARTVGSWTSEYADTHLLGCFASDVDEWMNMVILAAGLVRSRLTSTEVGISRC